jgi:hypothetical protein
MAVTQVYRVQWHWENSGRLVNHMNMDYVQAADNAYNTLKNVIVTNQGKNHGASTFVIDSVLNVGPGNIEQ